MHLNIDKELEIYGKPEEDESDHTEGKVIFPATNHIYANDEKQLKTIGVLPKGKYTFPFKFRIPVDCPASCSGKFGAVRYVIRFIIRKTIITSYIYNITVVNKYDLEEEQLFKVGFANSCSIYHTVLFFFRFPLAKMKLRQCVAGHGKRI